MNSERRSRRDCAAFELVSPERIADFSSPWVELLACMPHRLLPEPPVRFDWESRLDMLAAGGGFPQAVRNDLIDQNTKLGAAPNVIDKVGRIFGGEGGIVIAGQQPGLFGGPLYTLYKALTAVSLAEHLENRFGIPVVPVFWNAGDDDDFHEVRNCVVAAADGNLLTVSAMYGAGDRKRCVGEIPVDRIRPALEHVQEAMRGWKGSGTVDGLLTGSIRWNLWGEHFSYIVSRLFDGAILVYDAVSPVWRREAAYLTERFMVTRGDILEGIERRKGEMVSGGVRPPVMQETIEVPLTLIDRGVKRKFPEWDPSRIGDALKNDPSALCPNVTLRAPFQDALFPVIGAVVGPGEIAYLSQISPVYRGLGVREPVRVPRLTATVLPAALSALRRRTGSTRADLLFEWDRCVDEYAASMLPEDFTDRVDGLAGIVSRDIDELAGALGGDERIVREGDRIVGAVQKLARSGTAVCLKRLGEGGFAHREIKRFLRPGGGLQERVLSALVPTAVGVGVRGGILNGIVRAHLDGIAEAGSGHFLVDAVLDAWRWDDSTRA